MCPPRDLFYFLYPGFFCQCLHQPFRYITASLHPKNTKTQSRTHVAASKRCGELFWFSPLFFSLFSSFNSHKLLESSLTIFCGHLPSNKDNRRKASLPQTLSMWFGAKAGCSSIILDEWLLSSEILCLY